MKILLLVDWQNGFINGNLPVEGADEKSYLTADFIEHRGKQYGHIVATIDWHPITHCSFKENGGTWPMHCVQHSVDAALSQNILNAIINSGVNFITLTKGTTEDREEFSILKNLESNKALHALIETEKVTDIDICGIAGDVCVLDTIKDFHREFPDVRINVLLPLIASLDGGKKLNDFLSKNESIMATDNLYQ